MAARRRRPSRALIASAALAVVTAACTNDDTSPTAGAACGAIVREPLDPAYLVHPLGTSADIVYLTDPPTSGPHQAGPNVRGVVAEPITRPVQVGVLERGDVLIQHSPELASPQRATLESLAGDGVVVAPNVDLPEVIVATAWTHKRSCKSVDLVALKEFIDRRRDKGPRGMSRR